MRAPAPSPTTRAQGSDSPPLRQISLTRISFGAPALPILLHFHPRRDLVVEFFLYILLLVFQRLEDALGILLRYLLFLLPGLLLILLLLLVVFLLVLFLFVLLLLVLLLLILLLLVLVLLVVLFLILVLLLLLLLSLHKRLGVLEVVFCVGVVRVQLEGALVGADALRELLFFQERVPEVVQGLRLQRRIFQLLRRCAVLFGRLAVSPLLVEGISKIECAGYELFILFEGFPVIDLRIRKLAVFVRSVPVPDQRAFRLRPRRGDADQAGCDEPDCFHAASPKRFHREKRRLRRSETRNSIKRRRIAAPRKYWNRSSYSVNTFAPNSFFSIDSLSLKTALSSFCSLVALMNRPPPASAIWVSACSSSFVMTVLPSTSFLNPTIALF